MNSIARNDPAPVDRPRIALITNHGYAGVEIPVGGAPDTGGQNFYVNSLAAALEAQGFAVTIFARGGFPFFDEKRIREGTEQLSAHVRYVYVPGGGSTFLRKEDIAPALDEESAWLGRFICDEANAAGVRPWELYRCVNTHYWDAAVIGVKLVERWCDQVAHDFLSVVAGGALSAQLEPWAGDGRHRLGLSREIRLHLGQIALRAHEGESAAAVYERLAGHPPADAERLAPPAGSDPVNRPFAQALRLGDALLDRLTVEGRTLPQLFARVDTHVWTPHSVGIVKERNFWDKDLETVRALKFRERNAHEELICARTPLFCSTSPRIWRALASYHGVEPARIFDFPPCIDGQSFRPRSSAELAPAYAYLSERSGVPIDRLQAARILFETSRMDSTKRKDLLLEAFARVVNRVEDVYLFIGGGPAGGEIFKQLERLKASLPQLDGRAFLLGFVPDEVINELFSVPDLFVSASEMEGFGMSASQAAAAGVAVICSDLIPFATQYAPDAAVVVPAGDVGGFATAIERLLADDDERLQRAERLREIASALDWQATAGRFVDWFEARRPA